MQEILSKPGAKTGEKWFDACRPCDGAGVNGIGDQLASRRFLFGASRSLKRGPLLVMGSFGCR